MYIYKEQGKQLIREAHQEVLSELKIHSDFLISLLGNDDWSMVIKSHALVESIVTELIISRIEEPTMKAFVERLPLCDEQIGKLRIAKDYDLISKPARAFLKRFSELRNNLVHKAENVNFNFRSHIAELDQNQKKSWQHAFTWFEQESDLCHENSWRDATIENPKLAVWMAVFMFITLNSAQAANLRALTRVNLASEDTMKSILTGADKGVRS